MPSAGIQPGRSYVGRGSSRKVRRVVAIGPEHRPLGSTDPDGRGVLYVQDGRQGRAPLSKFRQWAAREHRQL